MSDGLDPVPLPKGCGISTQDWQQTPTSVQHQFLCLLKRVDALEARVNRDSSNSSRPPSTDAASKKRQRRTPATERHKPGAKPGHPSHPQARLDPTITMPLFPERCACGRPAFAALLPSHTHQVSKLPIMRPTMTHWRLHQGRCLSCGTLCKASLPVDQARGYGPRLTAFVGEMAGIVSTSRSAVQDLCASVCSMSLSTGAIPKMVDRVSKAIVPHDDLSGQVARSATVNPMDATSWFPHGDRQWLRVLTNPRVASLQMHPPRSKTAFAQLSADWRGILVSVDQLIDENRALFEELARL